MSTIKEVLLDATEGDVGGWECMVTGHSLGGALAMMCTRDLAENGVDKSKGLPVKVDEGGGVGELLGR